MRKSTKIVSFFLLFSILSPNYVYANYNNTSLIQVSKDGNKLKDILTHINSSEEITTDNEEESNESIDYEISENNSMPFEPSIMDGKTVNEKESSLNEVQESESSSLDTDKDSNETENRETLVEKKVVVSNWYDLKHSILNKDIEEIIINKDISSDDNESIVRFPMRSLKIDGQNHYIDFKSTSFICDESIPKNITINWEISNAKIYQQNFYGILGGAGSTINSSSLNGQGNIILNDIEYTGAQPIYGLNFNSIIKGNVKINTVNEYISPLDKKEYTTNGAQEFMETYSLYVSENSTLTGENNGNFSSLKLSGDLNINSGANVELISNVGNASVIEIMGDSFFKEHSNLSIITSKQGNQSAMRFSKDSKSLNMENYAKLSIKTQSELNPANSWYPNSLITMKNNFKLNIKNNAKLSIEAFKAGKGDSSSIIKLGSNSTLNVLKGSLDIRTDASSSSFSIINSTGATEFNIYESKYFNIENKNLHWNGRLLNLSGSDNVINIDRQDISIADVGKEKNPVSWRNISVSDVSVDGNGKTLFRESIKSSTPNEKISSSFILNFDLRTYRKITTELSSDISEDVVEVSNWNELNEALLNPIVTSISLKKDISNDSISGNRNLLIPLRGYTIDGNSHTLDVRGTSFYNNDNVLKNTNISVELKNSKLFGTNYYGPVKFGGSTSSSDDLTRYGSGKIKYTNINYEGAQLTASYTYRIEFEGNIVNNSVESYTSPFDSKEYTTQGGNQLNIEANEIIFLENSDYKSNSSTGSIYLGLFGKAIGVTLEENSKVLITSKNNDSGEYPDYLIRTNGGNFKMKKNSKLVLNTGNKKVQTAIGLTDSKGTFEVEEGAKLQINLRDGEFRTNASSRANVISLAKDSEFLVKDGGEVVISGTSNRNFNSGSFSRPSSVNSVVSLDSNSSFNVENSGSLIINLEGKTSDVALLYASAGSNFSFKNAKLIDLNVQKAENKSSIDLINMYGTFQGSLQKVEAWEKDNISERSDFLWSPISSMKVPYSGNSTQDSISISSINEDIIKDMVVNYRTENFNRIRFTYIPDVEIVLNELNDNEKSESSYILAGKATPYSGIVFSGDESIPDPKEQSKSNSVPKNIRYHTFADKFGNYSYQLPEKKFLTGGNKVTACAYFGGKEKQTYKIVDTKPKVNSEVKIYNSEGELVGSNTKTFVGDKINIKYTIFNNGKSTIYNPNINIYIPKNINVDYDSLKFENNGAIKKILADRKSGEATKIHLEDSNLENINGHSHLTVSLDATLEDIGKSTIEIDSTICLDHKQLEKVKIPTNKYILDIIKPRLGLYSVSDIQFGLEKIVSTKKKIRSSNTVSIRGIDEYRGANPWEIQLSMSSLKNIRKEELPASYYWDDNLFFENKVIYKNSKENKGTFNIIISANRGLTIEQYPGLIRSNMKYESTANWVIVNGP